MHEEGLEPPRLAAPEPKSGASANSATRARGRNLVGDLRVLKGGGAGTWVWALFLRAVATEEPGAVVFRAAAAPDLTPRSDGPWSDSHDVADACGAAGGASGSELATPRRNPVMALASCGSWVRIRCRMESASLLERGYTHKDAAQQLNLSPHTVHSPSRTELHATRRDEAVRRARLRGLISPAREARRTSSTFCAPSSAASDVSSG